MQFDGLQALRAVSDYVDVGEGVLWFVCVRGRKGGVGAAVQFDGL